MFRIAAVLVLLVLSSFTSTAKEPSRRLQELIATGTDLYAAGAFAEAVTIGEQTLALAEQEFGISDELTGVHAYGLGIAAEAAAQFDVAERAFARTVAIREAVYGRDSPAVALALEKLAKVLIAQGRPTAAEPHARRALLLRVATIGPDHAFAAPGHEMIGHVAAARGAWREALGSYRQAVRLLASQTTWQVSAKSVIDKDLENHRDAFVGLVKAAFRQRAGAGPSGEAALFDEAFRAAQQAWNTAAAGALAKMTARLGASDTQLGRSVRSLQERSDRIEQLNADDLALLASWSAVQKKDATYSALLEEFRASSIARSRDQAPSIARQRELVSELQKQLAACPPGQTKAGCENSQQDREKITQELGRLSAAMGAGSAELMAVHKRMEAAERLLPGYQAFTERRASLRADIDRLETEVASERRRILAAYPAYAALAEPGALSVRDVQGLLTADEVLVLVLVGGDTSFVFAIARERTAWAEIDGGARDIGADVQALRAGLDPLAGPGGAATFEEAARRFDLERSYGLYRKVLAPVAPVLAGKRHIIWVPTGPLTSLPLQVLVTAAPRLVPGRPTADVLREAEWLIRRHALSVLPSIPSLRALRELGRSGTAVQPFLGIGDPKLDGAGSGPVARGTLASFYRNGVPDMRAIRQLAPLPETATELEAVAKVMGASQGSLLLGGDASEAALKRQRLETYRILHFATHGLVAGELSELAEPALVLTPPASPTEIDDGLLTASEIAALQLDADWVVLSACNTAAGGRAGAEALSGLARAFFFAGARALLVSHWSVYSDAATALMIDLFGQLSADPQLSRAEAFQRAMLRAADAGKPPAYWAPFIIVGDGR